MGDFRKEKMENLIRQYASEFLAREASNVSLLTVTRSEMTSDLKKAFIYFTVLPENMEEQAVKFAKRNQNEMRDFLKKKMKSKFLPYIEFRLDLGEKNRQLIDQLTKS